MAARAFEHLAVEHDAAGDGPGAVAAAERLVSLDPLREDWQQLLLRLYACHFGRASAIGHARELAALLRLDLDIDPEPATLALIEHIRKGELQPFRPIQISA